MLTELVDCHTHSSFSDGASSVAQTVAAAHARGLTMIACTDHLTLPHDMDPDCAVSVAREDLDSLERAVLAAREAYPDVEVVHGFECDYYPGCEANVALWSTGATFLLGSVHMLDGRWIDDLDDLSYWEEHGTDAGWERYFDVWCAACASSCGFDSMAHPDLVMLLGRFPGEEMRSRLYARAAEAARAAGVHVEVSTAGLRKPVGRIYPAEGLLTAFHAAGVPITVGTDAHRSQLVGADVRLAYAYAFDAGYRFVDVPISGGGWRRLDL